MSKKDKDFKSMGELMIGHLVLMAGRTSKFDEVSVTKTDTGIAVKVEGQTFGVIQAVAAILSSLKNNNMEMPLDTLLDMVCYATRTMCSEECPYDIECGNTECMSKEDFQNLMNKLFNKKDKE